MSACRRVGLVGAFVLAVLCWNAALLTAGTLMWNFDQGDLSLTAAHAASATMSYLDEGTRGATDFGRTGYLGNPPNLPDGQARFLHHLQLPNYGRGGYTIDHTGLVATAGEDRVTSWTMVFDLYLPASAVSKYNGMFNSNPAQTDAADWYLYPNGAIGAGGLHVTEPGVLTPKAWHRLGLVYDGPRGQVEYWVDGQEVYDGPAEADSRYALWPSGHAGVDLVFQGDRAVDAPPFNYTSELYLASFALADFACLDYQMKSLGGPKAAGILLPPSPIELGHASQLTGPADLDLAGPMAYAINVGGASAATLGDVTFAAGASSVPGYTNAMQPGARETTPPEFGDGPGAEGLETLLGSFTWQDVAESPAAEVTLAVTPGTDYKLQLLFWIPYSVVSFDVSVEGVKVLDEFSLSIKEGDLERNVPWLFTYLLTAEDKRLQILFEGGANPRAPNHCPMLNALTLEILPPPAVLPGDANGDGQVNDLDASILASHWMQTSGATLADGDFTGDGRVDDLDASVLASHWLATSGGAAAAPEPSIWALLAVGGLLAAFLVRRRAAGDARTDCPAEQR